MSVTSRLPGGLVALAVAEPASAAGPVDYGKGVEGRIYKVDMPLLSDRARDRFLKLQVRLAREPDASDAA